MVEQQLRKSGALTNSNICYQFCVPRNLRIDIKDRLEEYSQSIEIDIHDCTRNQKSQLPPYLRFGYAPKTPKNKNAQHIHSLIAGLRQVWRHITVPTVLTQEDIPKEGG